MVRMSGYRAVVESLLEENVEYLFGLPGNPKVVYDQLYDTPEIKPILVRHECSGVLMAMAYSRISGKVGVCFASPGPGVANMVPGFLEAYYACTPLVAPCPSVTLENEGKGAFQECDQLSMFRPVTKWCTRVFKAERISWFMRRAFSLATNGKPGPVYIEIPVDVGMAEVEMPEYIPAQKVMFRGDPDRIRDAAELILKAERPLIISGGGLILSRGYNELLRLAEMLGIPVMTTPSGRGSIPEDHPLAIGQVGLYRTKIGKQVQNDSDLIITVGSRNEEFQSGAWKYFPKNAKYIQIDIDPFEIGRNWIPDVPIVGDARLVLEDLIDVLKVRVSRIRLEDMPRVMAILKAKREFEAEVEKECYAEDTKLKTKRVIRELNKVFGKDTILCTENGMQDLWAYYFPYYKVLNFGDTFPPAEQTLMGAAVAGSIGAKLASPKKKVVCTTGDGAFQMFMKEMPTAVQYEAPVTWIVLNNYSLGWIKYIQKMLGERFIATDFKVQPDFVKVAEANRCFGRRVERPRDVEPALREALKANTEGTPAMVEAVIEPYDAPEGFKDFHREIWNIPT
ncbi:MAG: thiamine pyrophosphate-binding protein [Candidatus Bathyarchaeia archaeon]